MTTRKAFGTTIIALALLLAAIAATPALAQYVPGAGFSGSPHDFSGTPVGTEQTGGCTYCHTPHRALQQPLLWNHTLSANTFSWDAGAVTAGGTLYPTIDTSWKGPTKLCLSCHDGSVAIGDIAWFNAAVWTGAAAIDPIKHDVDVFNIANPTTGSMTGNHPVAFPYPLNRLANTYNGTTTGGTVFTNDFVLDPTVNGIRLFTDNAGNISAGTSPGITGIECTSCHGVHNERGLVFGNRLLRGTLGGTPTSGPGATYICTKCHDRG